MQLDGVVTSAQDILKEVNDLQVLPFFLFNY